MTPLAVDLRPCGSADVDCVLAIRSEAFSEVVRATFGAVDEAEAARFRGRFIASRHQLICADGDVVGVLELEPDGPAIRIRTIALRAPARGRGIGTTIMRRILAEHPTVVLRVLKLNRSALRFYERLGFHTIGESDTHWFEMANSSISSSG